MVRKIFIKVKVKKNRKKISDRNFENGHLFLSNSQKWIQNFFKKHCGGVGGKPH